MKKIIIITGGNRGLGKALIDFLLKDKNAKIYSISRSLHEDHKKIDIDKLVLLENDLSKPFLENIFNENFKNILVDAKIFYFNNASIILPISNIGNLNTIGIENSIKVNIQYPVNLINLILNLFKNHELTLVNISSGAGVNPISHWSLYGASKAYMNMFFKVLEEENLNNKNINVFSMSPGVLDTGMQENIRENKFPEQDYFKSLKDNNNLITAENAAVNIFNKINYLI